MLGLSCFCDLYLHVVIRYNGLLAISALHGQIKLEKGFQKKTIVAFTNGTVFTLASIYRN